MTFDGSAIDGFSRVQESDVLARPDANTFQLIPWHGHDEPVARVFCDIFNLDLTPFDGLPPPRAAPHTRAGPLGRYTFFASPEVEFFLFRRHRDRSVPPAEADRLGLVLRPHRADRSSDFAVEPC